MHALPRIQVEFATPEWGSDLPPPIIVFVKIRRINLGQEYPTALRDCACVHSTSPSPTISALGSLGMVSIASNFVIKNPSFLKLQIYKSQHGTRDGTVNSIDLSLPALRNRGSNLFFTIFHLKNFLKNVRVVGLSRRKNLFRQCHQIKSRVPPVCSAVIATLLTITIVHALPNDNLFIYVRYGCHDFH